ncbi:MAG: hypothetical protein VKK04_06395 [Synechococcales bacterium]|nr:hypothetical protein [Synechococcales bacterium]
MFQTEFEFTLPKGYLDGEGNLHRTGIMRLAKAVDEIVPLRDPRVQANPAYATIIILSRVITRLGTLEDVNPALIEGLFAADLNFLYNLYRQINDLDSDANPTGQSPSGINAPSLTALSVSEG